MVRSGFRVLTVGVDNYECTDYIQYKLPCRHIFAIQEHFKYNLFDINLYSSRWTNIYDFTNQSIFLKSPQTKNVTSQLLSITPSTSIISSDNNHCIKSQKQKSKSERFKLMKEVAGGLAQVGHMVTNERFDLILELLQQIDDA